MKYLAVVAVLFSVLPAAAQIEFALGGTLTLEPQYCDHVGFMMGIGL